jgi:hypothetical protein
VFTKPFTRTTIFNLTTLLHCTATDFPTESNVQTGSGLKSKSPLFTSMHTRSLGVQINSVERCSTVKAGRSPPVFTRRSSRKDHMKRTATVVVGALLAGAWGKFMLASIDVKVRLQPWVYRYFAVPRGISEDPSRRAIQEYWILPDGRFWVHLSWYSAAFCAATWLIFCAALSHWAVVLPSQQRLSAGCQLRKFGQDPQYPAFIRTSQEPYRRLLRSCLPVGIMELG